jgi:hypothetical protein
MTRRRTGQNKASKSKVILAAETEASAGPAPSDEASPQTTGDSNVLAREEDQTRLPPELLDMIFEYVDRNELRELSLASRAWREVAFVRLMRTIDASVDKLHKLMKLPWDTHLFFS